MFVDAKIRLNEHNTKKKLFFFDCQAKVSEVKSEIRSKKQSGERLTTAPALMKNYLLLNTNTINEKLFIYLIFILLTASLFGGAGERWCGGARYALRINPL